MIDRVAYLIHTPTTLVKESQFDSEDDAPGPRQRLRICQSQAQDCVPHPSPVFMQPHLTSDVKEVCDNLSQKGLCCSDNNFKLKMYMSGETRGRQREKDLKTNHCDPH